MRNSVEADVMSVDRKDSVIVTFFDIQPEMEGYRERGEIISDYTKVTLRQCLVVYREDMKKNRYFYDT